MKKKRRPTGKREQLPSTRTCALVVSSMLISVALCALCASVVQKGGK